MGRECCPALTWDNWQKAPSTSIYVPYICHLADVAPLVEAQDRTVPGREVLGQAQLQEEFLMYPSYYTYVTTVSIERELAERHAQRQALLDAGRGFEPKPRPGGALAATIGRLKTAFRSPRWMIRPVQP